MKNFEEMTPEELQIFRLQFDQFFYGARIRLLEESLSAVLIQIGLKLNGKTLLEFLHDNQEKAFDDILRDLADDIPTKASEFSRYYKHLKEIERQKGLQ